VFSDGSVLPKVRVAEAWQDGLDIMAVTEHIEYRPSEDTFVDYLEKYRDKKYEKALNTRIMRQASSKDGIMVDLNRGVKETVKAAERYGLTIIPGSEITRDGKTNKAIAYSSHKGDAKRAELKYRLLGGSKNYKLLEIELITGRHHQIRCQLSKVGCPIKGDLKYGAKRSNQGGGISLHSRSVEFIHPVRKEPIKIVAPVPEGDALWSYFEESQA
jgi:23S rRNA pseudouridine1911/1915/1917 synthase